MNHFIKSQRNLAQSTFVQVLGVIKNNLPVLDQHR